MSALLIAPALRRLGAPLGFWVIASAPVVVPLQFHRWQSAPEQDAREQRTINRAGTTLSRWHAAGQVAFGAAADGSLTAEVRVRPAEWSALGRVEQDVVRRELCRFVLHGTRVSRCVVHNADTSRGA